MCVTKSGAEQGGPYFFVLSHMGPLGHGVTDGSTVAIAHGREDLPPVGDLSKWVSPAIMLSNRVFGPSPAGEAMPTPVMTIELVM